MIAGRFNNISKGGSFEFANMKATSNAETDFDMGHEPSTTGISSWTQTLSLRYEVISIAHIKDL
jgi:hypothetical protein